MLNDLNRLDALAAAMLFFVTGTSLQHRKPAGVASTELHAYRITRLLENEFPGMLTIGVQHCRLLFNVSTESAATTFATISESSKAKIHLKKKQ